MAGVVVVVVRVVVARPSVVVPRPDPRQVHRHHVLAHVAVQPQVRHKLRHTVRRRKRHFAVEVRFGKVVEKPARRETRPVRRATVHEKKHIVDNLGWQLRDVDHQLGTGGSLAPGGIDTLQYRPRNVTQQRLVLHLDDGVGILPVQCLERQVPVILIT